MVQKPIVKRRKHERCVIEHHRNCGFGENMDRYGDQRQGDETDKTSDQHSADERNCDTQREIDVRQALAEVAEELIPDVDECGRDSDPRALCK